MTAQARIFLAHAREDKAQVRKLYADLKARGFEPWLDEVDLVPRQIWKQEIASAIRQAALFLACLSSRSVKKVGYVHNEFRQALSAFGERPPGTIYLIPVRLDDCVAPDLQIPDRGLSFGDFHWVDLWEEGGFERLVFAMEMALGPGHPAAPLSDLALQDRPQHAVYRDAADLNVTPFETLTRSEMEVLELLRTGKANREIAQELNISESTVSAYLQRLVRLLQADENPKRLLSQPINEEALEAYTKWKFPTLPVDGKIQRLLLRDLDKGRYKLLGDRDRVANAASEAVECYKEEKPELFRTGTDYLTKSLGFVDRNFRKRHPFL